MLISVTRFLLQVVGLVTVYHMSISIARFLLQVVGLVTVYHMSISITRFLLQVVGLVTIYHMLISITRFLLQVVGLVTVSLSEHLVNLTAAVRRESCEFLCRELSHQLLYITHIFHSGWIINSFVFFNHPSPRYTSHIHTPQWYLALIPSKHLL